MYEFKNVVWEQVRHQKEAGRAEQERRHTEDSALSGQWAVGPQSVGHELPEKALAASGSICTATDVAVALGKLDFGSRAKALAGQFTARELQLQMAHSCYIAKVCLNH